MSQVESYWDKEAVAESIKNRIWLAHPKVKSRLDKLVTGSESIDKFDWFVEWLRATGVKLPVDRAISVGCGTGSLERQLCHSGLAREILGVDISQGSIEKASHIAEQEGIKNVRYRKIDLNNENFSEESAQVVLAQMAVHHIENLEYFFENTAKALSPGGFLFMYEYIGPKRFQWSPAQLGFVNRLLRALPEELRLLPDGTLRQPSSMPLEKEMIADDPSESVRSNEIIPVMKSWFDIVGYRPLRGALLHVLMTEITGNMMKSDIHGGYVTLLSEIEDIFTEAGMLDDHFAVVIARPHGWNDQIQKESRI